MKYWRMRELDPPDTPISEAEYPTPSEMVMELYLEKEPVTQELLDFADQFVLSSIKVQKFLMMANGFVSDNQKEFAFALIDCYEQLVRTSNSEGILFEHLQLKKRKKMTNSALRDILAAYFHPDAIDAFESMSDSEIEAEIENWLNRVQRCLDAEVASGRDCGEWDAWQCWNSLKTYFEKRKEAQNG